MRPSRRTAKISKKDTKPAKYATCTAATFRELTCESSWVEGTHHRSAVSSKIGHSPTLGVLVSPASSSVLDKTERQTVTGPRPVLTTALTYTRSDLELDRDLNTLKFGPRTLSL